MKKLLQLMLKVSIIYMYKLKLPPIIYIVYFLSSTLPSMFPPFIRNSFIPLSLCLQLHRPTEFSLLCFQLHPPYFPLMLKWMLSKTMMLHYIVWQLQNLNITSPGLFQMDLLQVKEKSMLKYIYLK